MRLNKTDLESMIEKSVALLKREDTLQAAEKLYKVAEECVKILEIQREPSLNSKDYWSSKLLWEEEHKLEEIYGEDLGNSWQAAWALHTEGFHENSMTVASVSDKIHLIQSLVNLLS